MVDLQMQKVAIVSDGSSDLPKELIEELNITIAPLQVILNGNAYNMYGDSGDLTKDEFYSMLETAKEFPTTSVPTPIAFKNAFNEALKKADSIIGIFISAQLSGTYQSAKRLSDEMFSDKDITLFDSKVAASTLGALVIEAAKMAKEGKTKDEILTRLNHLVSQGRLICVMDNVEATYRSGRLGWIKKFLVNTLKIRPIILFENGAIVPGGRLKGSQEDVINRMKKVAPYVIKNAITDTVFIWHVRYPEIAQILKVEMEKYNEEGKSIRIQEAGPVVGTHVGLKSLAFMYYGDYNEKWMIE
ncbi:MAG: DegV family protein [Asgard group archaeon]|nr:DegV family protein [Asgard group archaeon]